jgi:hypothetical protein
MMMMTLSSAFGVPKHWLDPYYPPSLVVVSEE